MKPVPAKYPAESIMSNAGAGTLTSGIPPQTKLLYDGECLICNRLACSLKRSNPNLELVDARQPSADRSSAENQDLDLNEGMAMIVDGRHYYAAPALTYCASNLRAQGLSGWLMQLLFRSERVTLILYPTLVRLRKLLLRLAGKNPIRALAKDTTSTEIPRVDYRAEPDLDEGG